MVAERYSSQMPSVGGNLCISIQGTISIGGKAGRTGELGSKGLAGSKEEVFPHLDKYAFYSILTLCPSIIMTLRHHSSLFRCQLVGRM